MGMAGSCLMVAGELTSYLELAFFVSIPTLYVTVAGNKNKASSRNNINDYKMQFINSVLSVRHPLKIHVHQPGAVGGKSP
jgi:hypothetical protein